MLRWPGILRYFRKTDVTICIPAFQAAAFIGRTLRCAQGQTYGRLRILVAVDKSTDDTAAICRRFAEGDPRIEVLEHEERLGWCGNVNSLLEHADTPFFFLYFHDDLILPQYCQELRTALIRSPEAGSANCDMLDFGLADAFHPGRAYDGPVATRLLTLWAAKHPGPLLRSMVRADRVGPWFRLPPEYQEGFTPGHVLQMRMVAAGPAVRVPEILYLRWIRKGGLTDGWMTLPYEAVLRGRQRDLAHAFAIVDHAVSDADDRHALKFALTLYAHQKVAHIGRREGRAAPRVSDLHPDAPSLDLPANIERFGPEIAANLRKAAKKAAAIKRPRVA